MSMSKFHHMTGCVFKWCASQKQWIRIKKQKKVCMPSRKKKNGSIRERQGTDAPLALPVFNKPITVP